MWEAVKHVLKSDGAFVTTASQPFTSLLVCSNLKWFRYEWIWDKMRGSNFIHAYQMPMKSHENIEVFYRALPTYNPQMVEGEPYIRDRRKNKSAVGGSDVCFVGGDLAEITVNRGERFPLTIIPIKKDYGLHPTQKPVALYKYLVQTYTNPGNTVLDMCMGSGTTGEACIELGRDFIGCETEEEHFLTAQERLDRVSRQGQLFTAASSANKGVNADKTRAEQLSIL